MTIWTKRRWRLALLPAIVSVALGGCAVDAVDTSRDSETPGRVITQNAPAPEYTVFYRDALRACLQTGRSELECTSGEDRFVRDALAVEAELSAQRKQRRQERVERATIKDAAPESTPPQTGDRPGPPRSVMFDKEQVPADPESLPLDLEIRPPSDD